MMVYGPKKNSYFHVPGLWNQRIKMCMPYHCTAHVPKPKLQNSVSILITHVICRSLVRSTEIVLQLVCSSTRAVASVASFTIPTYPLYGPITIRTVFPIQLVSRPPLPLNPPLSPPPPPPPCPVCPRWKTCYEYTVHPNCGQSDEYLYVHVMYINSSPTCNLSLSFLSPKNTGVYYINNLT